MESQVTTGIVALFVGIAGTLAMFPLLKSSKTVQQASLKYKEPIPIIDAYYQGEKVWFIHTDTSDKAMATMLSRMVDYPSYHSPALLDAVNLSKIPAIYVFKNGINRSGVEPWGGGAFHKQIDVIGEVPGDPGYMPLRRPHIVKWNENATPRVLKSVNAIQAAEAAGKLTITPTDMVVTAPIVRFPGRKQLEKQLLADRDGESME